jgi:PAS domain S-box-containing protein
MIDKNENSLKKQPVGESEALFRGLFENSSDAIQILDNNIFVECNQATVEILRAKNKEEVLSIHPSQLSPEFQPDGRPSGEKADEMIRTALEKGGHRFEWMHRRADGEVFPVEVMLTPVTVGNKTIIYSSWRDITNRKQAEAQTRETQQLLQSFLNNFPDGAWVKDLEGRFLMANRYLVEDIYGSVPDEIVGKNVYDLFPEDVADFLWESEKRLIETGEILSVEEAIPQADGKTYEKITTKFPLYDVEGSINGLGGVLIDITDRKRLEAQVQEAFERRGYQVQVSTEISQQISQATELGELFERVVTLTKERLGYYHTQLLRYDPNQDAVVLTAGYGETGQKMFAEGHHMPMGSGLIGTAAATGKTVMRPELAQDPDWKPNPLLPDTKGEIAVPIKLGDEVLGVLDVQSDRAGALSEDDRLLLEGLCGQIAIAMDQTRLRQEMEERLQEINNLYRAMSHEGWQSYRETADLPGGFVYDQIAIRPVEETGLAKGLFTNAPMVLPGGEMLGELGLADDPDKPLSKEDKAFLEQVSEQVALALESARLSEQTQFALSQSERLFDASRDLTQATDLQELVAATVRTLDVSAVNRAMLTTFDYDSAGEIEQLTIIANWWNGEGHEVTPVGTRYSQETIRLIPMFVSPTPIFFDDTFTDERVDEKTREFVKRLNLRAVAVLPLHLGSHQIGALFLEAENPHNFTPDEIRLFSSLAPQVATVLENRQQYEKARRQAEREAMLNTINQKIQSATSVDAVLQIAARELGHALGAPMTIAQLSMRDQN